LPLIITPVLSLVLIGLVLVGIGTFLAQAIATGIVGAAATRQRAAASGMYLAAYYLGGLIGTLLTIPAAKLLGRRAMFGIYYLLSGAALLFTFGLDLPPEVRLRMYFLIGLTVFGVFGSFTYYLPELFPTRLRGTGAGFCYNAGRIIASVGPFLVGTVAARGPNSLRSALEALFWVGFVPLVGVLLLAVRLPGRAHPLVIETKGRELA